MAKGKFLDDSPQGTETPPNNRSTDLMRIHIAGLEASIEDTARELKCAGRLCSVEVIDERSSRPILNACVDECESTGAIMKVRPARVGARLIGIPFRKYLRMSLFEIRAVGVH